MRLIGPPQEGLELEYVNEKYWGPGDTYSVYHALVRFGDMQFSFEHQTLDEGKSEAAQTRKILERYYAQT